MQSNTALAKLEADRMQIENNYKRTREQERKLAEQVAAREAQVKRGKVARGARYVGG